MEGASTISFRAKDLGALALQERVTVNPLTGAAVISVPLPLTSGRFNFGPSLSLQYSSAAGNSVYGVGWSLAGMPTIGLSPKQLPKYDGQDGFVFNGSDELVPALQERGGTWEPRIEDEGDFWIHYYRSKVEQAYIRFEKWVHKTTGRVHWRSRDANNVVSIYGLNDSGTSRIADPKDPTRTYLWLVEAQYDSLGNAIFYEYESENGNNVDIGSTFERDRLLKNPAFAQRYLTRICYGNTQPLAPDSPVPADNTWLFEVLFDYEEHGEGEPLSPDPRRTWLARPDPYSNYRPGFEVRTYRLCRRIMMVHNFTELGADGTLVGTVRFNYHQDEAGTTLESIGYTGFRRDSHRGEMVRRSLPPLKFEYSTPTMGQGFRPIAERATENFPSGFGDLRYRWVDLFSEGLPGILTETNQAWYYKPNEGGGNFGHQQVAIAKPAQQLGTYALTDFERNGNLNVVILQGRQAGFYEYDRDAERWQNFKPFTSAPQLDALGSQSQWLDLNGDGQPDILISKPDRFIWYPSKGKEGFGEAIEIAKPQTPGMRAPQRVAEDLNLDFFFADMNGDGLLDLVRIQNGRVEYWPQLGNGRFGEGILMEGAPRFDFDSEFDGSRLRLVDLDGSGTTDLLYLGRGEIRYWINASGNSLVAGGRLASLPYMDNLSSVQVLDFLGDGTACLVWSSALPSFASSPLHYLQLTNGVKPRLLLAVDNSMGKRVELSYGSSGEHYLRDKRQGRGWISKLPNHPTVVNQMAVIDQIGNSRLVSRYEYHDGYFDSEEREFRGFGLVEQYDAETFEDSEGIAETYTAPACIRTWYHNGAFGWDTRRFQQYYKGDLEQGLLPAPVIEELGSLRAKEYEDGIRALAGQMIRQEVYAVTAAGQRAEHPYQINQTTYRLRRLQPSRGEDDACFTFYQSEQLSYTYEQQSDDPRVTHQLTLKVDPYGNVEEECAIAYPRRPSRDGTVAAQQQQYITASRHSYINIDEGDRYELGIPLESQDFEVRGPASVAGELCHFTALQAELPSILDGALPFHESLDPSGATVQARLLGWNRNYYWNEGRTEALLPEAVRSDPNLLHNPTLLHHQETACFTNALIGEVLGSRVDAELLETEGRYGFKQDYWWQRSPIQHYLAAAGFYALTREEQVDGGTTDYTYDAPYYLTLVEVRDALGNLTQAEIDYYAIAPHRITDLNDNVAEVLYDPLGMIVVSTAQGSILHPEDASRVELYGNARLADYNPQLEVNFAAILAAPERFLQNASQFFYYELDSRGNSPLRSISLVREQFVHDGRGGGTPDSPIQIAVAYADGFGRTLQGKQRVEAGDAIVREETGAVVLDAEGRPVMAHCESPWLVSGHIVYNNKQQPVRQYEPFFSTSVDFESDEVLRTYGVSTLSHYDAMGRQVQVDLPNGTFTKVETTPWEVRSYDPNDTILEEGASRYRLEREILPNGSPEKQALRKAQAHAHTPSVVKLDPLGREVVQVEVDSDRTERITQSQLDIQGNVTAITDPRGLTAFTYRHDMLGRVLHEHSIDGGDIWSLSDALERLIHQWDGRGVHQEFSYDFLGRLTTVRVEGLGREPITTERLVYGEDGSVTDPELKNARGRLVQHYDQGGIVTVHQYDPEGNPLRSERELVALEDCQSEPNWSEDVSLDPSGFVTEATYDALGRVTSQTLSDGTRRSLAYLPSGGVSQVRVTTADGRLVDVPFLQSAEFNARGQRTGSVLGNGVEITYHYDGETFRMQRLTAQRPVGSESGERSRTYQDIEYVYDPAGNLTYCLDRAQHPRTASPDCFRGLNVSSHCEFTYDAFYQLKEATGRVHQALLPRDYRPGLPESIKGSRFVHLNNLADVERYRRRYYYDLSGNLRRMEHKGYREGLDIFPDGSNILHEWNREMWISPTSNRSLPAEELNGLPITDQESRFDANGNCSYLPHLRAMAWNYRNNLSRALIIDRSEEGKPDDVEYYVYGGDGMRVRKIQQKLIRSNEDPSQEQLEITEKIYLDGCEIKRVHRNGEPILERTTSHISDGTNRVAVLHQWTVDRLGTETDDVTQKKVHYKLSNHLGSTSLELDRDGAVISYEEYFPFGGTAFIAGRNVREVKLKEYRYCGKERDDSTSFYYYGYRYYAPWMGRWLSPDPVGPEDSVNLYQFVQNNPINLIDPNGLDPQIFAAGENLEFLPEHLREPFLRQYPRQEERQRVIERIRSGELSLEYNESTSRFEPISPEAIEPSARRWVPVQPSTEGIEEQGERELETNSDELTFEGVVIESRHGEVIGVQSLEATDEEQGTDEGTDSEEVPESDGTVVPTTGGSVSGPEGEPADSSGSSDPSDTGSASLHSADGSSRRGGSGTVKPRPVTRRHQQPPETRPNGASVRYRPQVYEQTETRLPSNANLSSGRSRPPVADRPDFEKLVPSWGEESFSRRQQAEQIGCPSYPRPGRNEVSRERLWRPSSGGSEASEERLWRPRPPGNAERGPTLLEDLVAIAGIVSLDLAFRDLPREGPEGGIPLGGRTQGGFRGIAAQIAYIVFVLLLFLLGFVSRLVRAADAAARTAIRAFVRQLTRVARRMWRSLRNQIGKVWRSLRNRLVRTQSGTSIVPWEGAIVPYQQPGGAIVPYQQPGGAIVPYQQPGGAIVPYQQSGGAIVPYQQSGGAIVPWGTSQAQAPRNSVLDVLERIYLRNLLRVSNFFRIDFRAMQDMFLQLVDALTSPSPDEAPMWALVTFLFALAHGPRYEEKEEK